SPTMGRGADLPSPSLGRAGRPPLRWGFFRKGFLLLVTLSLSKCLYAQQLSLPDLEKRALENNRTLTVNGLEVAHQQSLVGTYREIPKTNVELQYGNIQTPFVGDYAFTVMQSFDNPKVFQARKKLLETYVQQANVALDLQKIATVKQVRENYFRYVYSIRLQELLTSELQVYGSAAKKATLRYNLGESGLLEKVHFETQLSALQNRETVIRNQSVIPYLNLQNLTASADSLEISTVDFRREKPLFFETSELPFLRNFDAQKSTIDEQIKLTQQQLKPGFVAGITNQSMEGSLRQFVVTGGLNIPIFNKSEKAKIEALRIENKVIDSKVVDIENQLLTEIQTLRAELLTTNQTLNYYQETAIPQADLMISTASKQYNEGDINYLDFQLIYAQAIGIRETYLQEQLKQKLIETNIQFITGK
ncbi:MAG: TolC family protein, partial [Spirosomaceae bacterium]|nr:TolC family protein [Spirosomataceae bacterium]